MAEEELNVSLFGEQAIGDLLANPPQELHDAVKEGLKQAFADSEVKQAFLAMFSEEERQSLSEMSADDLAAALNQELSHDKSFQEAILESVTQWADQAQLPTIPQSAEELDAIVSQYQLSSEQESPHEPAQATEQRPAHTESSPAAGVTPA